MAESEDHPLLRAPRSLYIMRHGERMDFVFKNWIQQCYNSGGYRRCDLNQPSSLPERGDVPWSFSQDTPLTELGAVQAFSHGMALRESGIKIGHVYSSPALRCVETAYHVLKGLEQVDVPICVEPGLFEWMHWYRVGKKPTWMTLTELSNAGFNIQMKYDTVFTTHEIQHNTEKLSKFYERGNRVVKAILQEAPPGLQPVNILIIGHTATHDTCTRQLLGRPIRKISDFTKVLKNVPYCSMAVFKEETMMMANGLSEDEEGIGNGEAVGEVGRWEMVKPPIQHFTNAENPRFKWEMLRKEDMEQS